MQPFQDKKFLYTTLHVLLDILLAEERNNISSEEILQLIHQLFSGTSYAP